MKKCLIFGICFIFVVGIESTYGQPLKRHTLEIRPEIYYFTYKEPGVMKDHGVMYGAALSYTYHRGVMLKAEARGAWGHVDYINSGSINHIRDYVLEFRGLGGWDFILDKSISMTPYIGIGYRYLNDDTSGRVSSTGALGYERESNYIYSPLGLEFNIDLGNKWSLGEIAEFDYFWWGKQKSHLSDVFPGFNDLSNRQKSGWGFRGSLALRKQFKVVDFEFGPFIRYWQIKKSEEDIWTLFGFPIGIGWEPKNRSTEIGIMMALKF
jgi:hypothetical protein